MTLPDKSSQIHSLSSFFQIWPNITKFCQSCKTGQEPKETPTFNYAEIDEFLRDGNDENRYILVRKVVAITALYFGQFNSLSGAKIRNHSLSNLSLESDGSYRITLPPCVERDFKRTEEIRYYMILLPSAYFLEFHLKYFLPSLKRKSFQYAL